MNTSRIRITEPFLEPGPANEKPRLLQFQPSAAEIGLRAITHHPEIVEGVNAASQENGIIWAKIEFGQKCRTGFF
ncbi:hypothetical protein LJR030_001311 [Rhizobium sp. LjRoot30]|uniref:hypothetical protein n=1 Tax=Rhizobium sp. LjRoot30 TaxID=3342320 RepID=UPI003ECDA983